ncbi:hypothetical protein AAG906_005583 [Vitis piasezkii]
MVFEWRLNTQIWVNNTCFTFFSSLVHHHFQSLWYVLHPYIRLLLSLVLITLGVNDFVNNYYLVPNSTRSRQFTLPNYVCYLISKCRKNLMVILPKMCCIVISHGIITKFIYVIISFN